jgi:hypothetical protein
MIIRYRLNPLFVISVFFFALVGYLFNDIRGAVWGALIMCGISFTIGLIDFIMNINKSEYEKMLDEVRRYYGK